MASRKETLLLIASKLGLSEEDKVLSKAAELERLLQTKMTAGSIMSDTSKIVICLDLAAYLFGVDLDTKAAIKYSGLKQSLYINSRNVVENLLELNSDTLTVPGLCVKMQCSGVEAVAENILEEYQKQAKMEIDLNLPQYICMAVHQACRLNKVKVSKAKLLEMSRLKPGQWSKLEAEWTKFANDNFGTVKKKRGDPMKITINNDEMEIDKSPKKESKEILTESYKDWKKRMLQTAYEEKRQMEKLRKQEIKKPKVEKMEEEKKSKHSQRQSPRKSSQLMSPKKLPDSSRKVICPLNRDQLTLVLNSKHLSPRKHSQCSSPKKENQLSPRKDASLALIEEGMSPRRSPRKTPQKSSPYKIPKANNGVRLLFPKNF